MKFVKDRRNLPPLNDSSAWKPDGYSKLVYTDWDSPLRFPCDSASVSMDGTGPEIRNPKCRIFVLEAISGGYLWKISTDNPSVSDSGRSLWTTREEAFSDLCKFHNERLAQEILDDTKYSLEKYGFRLKDQTLLPIGDEQ
jgi:hypothetical protein